MVVEALLRLQDQGPELARSQASVRESVERYLLSHAGQQQYLDAVSSLELKQHADGLTSFLKPDVDASLQVDSIRLLVEYGEFDRLKTLLEQNDDSAVVVANGLGLVGGDQARELLQDVVTSPTAKASLRIAATSALGRGTSGQRFLLELIQAGILPSECYFAATDALLASSNQTLRKAVTEYLKPTGTKSGKIFPPISRLIRRRGDGKAGKLIFRGKGTCSKCHKVHGDGQEVGPDLSEIGSKLSREATYVAILNPNAGISHNYEQYTAVTIDGFVLTGLLVNQNDDAVTLKTAEGVVRTIARDDIEELKQNSTSLMPENLHQLMSVQELLDLVDYLMLLKNKKQAGFHVHGDKGTEAATAINKRDPENAVEGIDIAEGLAATLFSAEPDLYSPSNIDVDHLGRVWVCEVVNYRHFRNPYNRVRKDGDRILVLEDTDGNGRADKKTLFYQGTDINSPHGVCVLGDRVIVSAGNRVTSFRDLNGDLKPDEKTLLFTGIGGVEHDHGIHAFTPGPDGKLYFNFGNEGHQLKDANGNIVVDKFGREVRDHGEPYQQGMVFRCDVDGTNVETLAWNFRNNWEVCVDSFGTMWQSDNDDDGNRATRINYVMPYGNYGYRGELDKSTWSVPRTGMHSDVSLRHWHLNDPGVVPNVVQTGAGSPTGIMAYEGDLLPKRFHGQLIHCDPGPNSVRSYVLQDDAAGYAGKISPLMTGSRDRWFRPVDACAAPDGSLFVADWYDPGVGGHRMGDTERGRVFRLAPADHAASYAISTPDLSTVSGAIEALQSPNVSMRFLAAERLRKMGDGVIPQLIQFIEGSESPLHRARALWVLGSLSPKQAIELASEDGDHRVRCVALRIVRQSAADAVEVASNFASDSSPQVRREAAILLRGEHSNAAAKVWSQLAQQHDGKDRWYLEALGIAASGNWDQCLEKWLSVVGDGWKTSVTGRDIVWRSRSKLTPNLLAGILTGPSLPQGDSELRYLRAFDFQAASPEKDAALVNIATSTNRTTDLRANQWRPKVWIITDMSDKRVKRANDGHSVNDPDDISAMAGYLLMANEFETLGIVVTSTHRDVHQTSSNQAAWANEYFGEAYRSEVSALNKAIGGYPDDIQFTQSCIKETAERYNPKRIYRSLAKYDTIAQLLATADTIEEGETLNVLCWGSLTEPAILVNHCLATGKHESLKRLRFITHWTNSPLHQGSPEHPERVANCREDAAACSYIKQVAADKKIAYYECGAIGQHGIVNGAPKGHEYYDQFRTSKLGNIFVEGKFAHNGIDHSDSATYWTLLGKWGVRLKDIPSDGTNSATIEKKNETAFRRNSRRIHEELLKRSRAAAGNPKQ
ncbi:PVC-type heme-binding CxxCH protein [Rhodopirellula sallentina]|uniref:PVC-type heme-binding CxxCH protein n=1 Tax=Rhodopirellula sallentina TaxID=1263869 RepID=UPI001EFFAAB4|nr:PVC-type heme-binding CxxCH protein [Rhodopirellula sallentina]